MRSKLLLIVFKNSGKSGTSRVKNENSHKYINVSGAVKR